MFSIVMHSIYVTGNRYQLPIYCLCFPINMVDESSSSLSDSPSPESEPYLNGEDLIVKVSYANCIMNTINESSFSTMMNYFKDDPYSLHYNEQLLICDLFRLIFTDSHLYSRTGHETRVENGRNHSSCETSTSGIHLMEMACTNSISVVFFS